MHPIKLLSVAMLAAAVAACSSNLPTSKPDAPNNEDWYQVRTESELFLFDDYAVFREFLVTGKAPILRKLDQKDKYGQEIVLALRAEDQGKDLKKIPAYQFLNIAMPPASPFYGEVRQEGIIYVFARYGDMIDMYNIGEPIFSHTEIGSGPNGERVVYVLAKEEKKPVKQIALFQQKYKS